jgi:hypothetical protein
MSRLISFSVLSVIAMSAFGCASVPSMSSLSNQLGIITPSSTSPAVSKSVSSSETPVVQPQMPKAPARNKALDDVRSDLLASSSRSSSVKKTDKKNSGGASEGTEFIYGRVILAGESKLTVNPDKSGNSLVSINVESTNMTREDISKFKRGMRVKMTCEKGTHRCTDVVIVTGKEAQVKIKNRADCLTHYGTGGAKMCFEKYKK